MNEPGHAESDRISGNRSIDCTIQHCFTLVGESDALTFRKRFKTQREDPSQVMHTFRELLLGAYLCHNGLAVKFEYPISEQTPDWCLVENGEPRVLVELMNFDPQQDYFKYVTPSPLRNPELADYIQVWSGWVPDQTNRLYDRIWKKFATYKVLSENHSLGCVVAVFSDFLNGPCNGVGSACVNDNEDGTPGLFQSYPHVSGLLMFYDNVDYFFEYFASPYARIPVNIPSGRFALPRMADLADSIGSPG